MTSMVSTLQEMGLEIREEVPKLNWGGCAVYAALVGSRLEELGYIVRGVVSDYYRKEDNLTDLYNSIRPRNAHQWNKLSDYTHVLLTVDIDNVTYLHDSDYTIEFGEDVERDPTCRGILMAGDIPVYALRSLASAKIWNYHFKRKEAFPIIERLIEKHLGTFERSRRSRYIRTDGLSSFDYSYGPC